MKKIYRIIGAMFVCVICLSLCGCSILNDLLGKKDNDTAADDAKPYVSNRQSIGGMIQYDGLDVIVDDVYFSNYCGGVNGYGTAHDGNTWCVIHVSIKNTNTSAVELKTSYASEYNFTLYYDGKYKYLSSYSDQSEFLLSNYSIQPLSTVSGVLSYEVPEEVKTNTSKELCLTFGLNKYDVKPAGEWDLRS